MSLWFYGYFNPSYLVIQLHALGGQVVGHDLGDGLGHGLQILVLLTCHDTDSDQCILSDQGIALLVVLQCGFHIGGELAAGLDESAVTADERTNGTLTADDFQTLAEDLGGQNFHGGVCQVGGDVVGVDALNVSGSFGSSPSQAI